MKIIAENEQERYAIKMLIDALNYSWHINGRDSDVFYKVFEHINDRPECWKDGELIKDYEPDFLSLMKVLEKQKVEIEK